MNPELPPLSREISMFAYPCCALMPEVDAFCAAVLYPLLVPPMFVTDGTVSVPVDTGRSP